MALASTGKTIVHVKVGVQDMGDGQPPFIPERPVLDETAARWQAALGPDYLVIATHFGEEVDFYDEHECDCI
jgi:hypothetical protein